MTIIYAIIIFCILIFVHEFGHFIAAKSVGIKVNEFAIGMGPKLLKFQKGETLYSIRAFPIGGFCAMEGEDEDSDDPRAFNKKPFWAKTLVIVAGALMNAILAIIILSCVIFSIGTPTTTIDKVVKDSPAIEAGIKAGDTIKAIDGKDVKEWDDISEILADVKGQEIVVNVEHENGKTENIKTDVYKAEDGTKKIGIESRFERTPGYALKSVKLGVAATGQMAKMMYEIVGDLFTGDASVNDFTGPVGIVNAVGESAKVGFVYVAQLAALISLNLAIINMLPLPALDGGRLIFLIIRKFTGKKISDETEGKIHFIGMMLLFGLMIYITVLDVDRFLL